MAQENRVSVQIKPEDVKKVLDALKVIQDTLKPYLIALTPKERQDLAKMSDGNAPFVQKALEYAESNPEFAPPYLDVKELKIDLKAVETLLTLFRPTDQINMGLSDTIMLSGSEAFVAALAYYNTVKLAAKMNIPGAKPIYEDLKKRFEGQDKKKTAKNEDTSAQNTST